MNGSRTPFSPSVEVSTGSLLFRSSQFSSVLAGGEIDLLAIRISLACKVSKEIVGVVRIRNFRRSRLNSDGDFFCFSHILHGHRSGHSHNRIFLRPGNRTCGSGVIALVFHSFYVDDL